MVAYKVLHSMKIKQRGKTGRMAINLDMSKAYNKKEWAFMEAVMKKLRFCENGQI